MKKTFSLALAIMSVTVTGMALASPMMGGWGMNSRYGRMYDPRTVETVSGEVLKIDKIMPMRGMSYGIHIALKTGKGEIPVHLGPAWYIDRQSPAIKAGDKLEVKGSRIMFRGEPVIIAAEIRKGDEILKLRDDSGYPAWAGWRRGRQY